MTTRRDLIKLGSALGLAGTVPTIAERIAAVQLLDGELSDRNILDPGSFAVEANASIADGMQDENWDFVTSVCPEHQADYFKADEALDQLLARLGAKRAPEYLEFNNASLFLLTAMYDAGLRHGAAYEHLRRSMVGEVVVCRTCFGLGITKDEATCTVCGGTGTVALKGGKV